MKLGLYPKLALEGFRKNKRMYLPYLLTCAGMVMMHYIISFLNTTEALASMPGSNVIQELLGLGTGVIAVFACIFLFYTNSFLMRRRKKEFGLYNILGMGKRNISIILLWENLMIAAASLLIGLIAGVAFSKLAELGIVNLMHGETTYALSVSAASLCSTLKVFSVIFLLLFLNGVRQIRFSSAISLVRSENTGEKPPRGNWLVGLLGLVLLAAAYYIAVTIKDPLSALVLFFVAVIMVIIGTYLLMIFGSVVFCRLLQKRKKYYYKTNHFVSVSSMVYRMKRNGAGLASICILATMVLVMISSTTALFAGTEDSLNKRYPREIGIEFMFTDAAGMSDDAIMEIRRTVELEAEKQNITPDHLSAYRSASIAGWVNGTAVETDASKISEFNMNTYSDTVQIHFIPLSDYNEVMGTEETLAEGETLIWTYRTDYCEETFSFNGGNTFRIKSHLDDFFASGENAMTIIPSVVLIVPDLPEAVTGLADLTFNTGNTVLQCKWNYNFDTGLGKEEQRIAAGMLREAVQELEKSGEQPFYHVFMEAREEQRADFVGLYGGLFYLGIILSIVFLFATVLIIYYKQISEGYEDQSRFEIMQKVGITKKEIRKSINSQLLTVFFLPLIMAGCHLIFAFPMIQKLLNLLQLNNVGLFAATTAISFLVFALFYLLVYRATSNAYYKIVSGMKEN